jgi:predicted ATPase with chaperone activity
MDTLKIENFLKTESPAAGILKKEPPVGPAFKPRKMPEVGVRQAILEDLALKTLYLSGPFSVLELSKLMRLSYEIATELFNRMRAELLCQVNGMSNNIPNISITAQGRVRAMELLAHNHYTGAAPVSLSSYVDQVRKQSVRNVEVHPSDVARSFAHLVIDDKTLWQLGTSLNSGSSVFLYGPPGTGKTTIAETLSHVLAEDDVWVPHAIEIDGQIITVFDPVIHHREEAREPADHDERWVLCNRPAVLVGGELTIDMLDLQFNALTHFYVGPVQMKANNGVLIIDDFGRQRVRPEDLLNRWVVPLDRRIDFLTLAGGKKIEIPFEMLVVFASNMDPYELVDPAFLRRIQTKIKIGEVSDAQFFEIFRRVAAERGLVCDPGIVNDLIDVIRDTLNQELRSCYPRDIINQICWAAKYEGRRPHLDLAGVMKAVEAYFLPKT